MRASNNLKVRLLNGDLKENEPVSVRLEILEVAGGRVTVRVLLVDGAGAAIAEDEPRELGPTDTFTIELGNLLTLVLS